MIMFNIGDYVINKGIDEGSSIFLITSIDESLNIYFVRFFGTLTKDKFHMNQGSAHMPYFISFESSSKYSVISEQINKLLTFQ